MTRASQWQELVAAALVGSERGDPPLAGDGSVGSLLAGLDPSSRERRLLAAAGVLSLYRQAGAVPVRDARPLPEACGEERLPGCGPAAGRRLAAILGGGHAEVLPEWLGAAGAAGLRAPAVLLPALLDLGGAKRDLREYIGPVLGERGRWLAAQNPEWAYAVGVEEEADWETAARDARVLLLKRLRAQDPGKARELLRTTWGSEPPEERTAFLPVLLSGLSHEDEPFLEAALDDRRKEVRTAAADLLARLPASRLCRRVLERVRPLLLFTPEQKPRIFPPSAGRKAALVVTLPETHDRGMARDGIEAKPPYGMGEKAWWLQQMVGVVPPATWCAAWKVSAREILALAEPTEWRLPLLGGWAKAAGRHGDHEWAEVLLPAAVAHLGDEAVEALMAALPPERREAMALAYLRREDAPARARHPALTLLEHCRHPWSEGFTRAVLRFIRGRAQPQGNQYDWYLQDALPRLALRAAPSLAPEASEMLPLPVDGYWRGSLERFLELLHFRREMMAELEEREMRR